MNRFPGLEVQGEGTSDQIHDPASRHIFMLPFLYGEVSLMVLLPLLKMSIMFD